jgi:hypothetical protein
MMMIVTMIFTLIINDPFLTFRLIWLVGVDVLKFGDFISKDIHPVTGKSILESLGG